MVLLAVALLAVTVIAVLLTATGSEGEHRPGTSVVVVLTDDQDVGSMRFMPKTERLLVDEGTVFENSFVTTPLCCPARASYLTGQYAHNHRVLNNQAPRGGWYALDDSRTLAVWLSENGYRTGYVGKVLNQYGQRDEREVPPGWTRWYGALSPKMYDYALNENGTVVRYGTRPSDYQTDVLADKAVVFIRSGATGGQPFFLTVATSAPHTEGPSRSAEPNPRPAPRHEGRLQDEPLPRPPSFDEADVSDKPTEVRSLPPLSAGEVESIVEHRQARLGSLLAVDDLVGRVVEALEETGRLGDTLVVFTSDNGYFHGEHRIPGDKRYAYEESVRVPLVVRGPEVPRGATRTQPAANIDLAPTILDATDTPPPREHPLDGRSLLPMVRDRHAGAGRDLLFEYFKDPGYRPPPYTAVRTSRYVSVRYRSGDEELYDLARDPFQLESRHTDPALASVRQRLRDRLDELEDCAGRGCR